MAIPAIISTAFENAVLRILSFSTPCRRRKCRHVHVLGKRASISVSRERVHG